MTKALTAEQELITARKFILNEFLRYAAPSIQAALTEEIYEAFGRLRLGPTALRAELYDIADYYYDGGLDAKMAIHELFD